MISIYYYFVIADCLSLAYHIMFCFCRMSTSSNNLADATAAAWMAFEIVDPEAAAGHESAGATATTANGAGGAAAAANGIGPISEKQIRNILFIYNHY